MNSNTFIIHIIMIFKFRFLLGIVDSDSAVVYYRISDGLVPPERPEELEAKKLKSLRYRERRKQRNMK